MDEIFFTIQIKGSNKTKFKLQQKQEDEELSEL